MHDKLTSIVDEMIESNLELRLAVQEFEAMFIRRVLHKQGGNLSASADCLGMHRNTLARKMKILNVEGLQKELP